MARKRKLHFLPFLSQACLKEMKECDWLQQWTDLAKRFAFQYNPALQPRAIIVYGCISKSVTDSEIKQLLRILVKVSEIMAKIDE